MANTGLRMILPQIQRLFAGDGTPGMSDGVLLRRFCASRDENSFATLVARHGGMVLGVCRGVLRDETQAEDAFQAVFLVLVRRANSIRVDDSLGGWLHEVAYRVARRSYADGLKRAARERHGLAVFGAEARELSDADARIAQIHEEIARLPVSLRQVVVLCLLEGKTQVEAATEIGCGEATVRRRLAAARERLRTRLRQQDVTLPPPLIVTQRLIDGVTKLATGPTSALASAIAGEMARAHLLKAVAIVGVIGLTAASIAAAVAARHTPVIAAAPQPQEPAERTREVATAIAAPAGPVVAPVQTGEVEIPGRVVGPDGKPVAGASVFRRQFGVRPPELKTTTNPDGRFSFKAQRELGTVRAAPNDPGAADRDGEEVKHIKPWLVAAAPGYGFGTLSAGAGVTIKLVPDEPVVGRLVDRAGKPISGARIRVRNVYWPRRADDPLLALENRHAGGPPPEIPKGEGLEPWLARVKRAAEMGEFLRAREILMGLIELGLLGDLPSVYAPLIPAATSDTDGRFRLAGIGRERVAELYIDGVPGKASTLIVVVTRALDPIVIPAVTAEARKIVVGAGFDLPVFGCQFEATIAPGRTIAGTVSDRKTGLPLRGVKVLGPTVTWLEYPGFDRFFATTDALGRYRIDGFPVMDDGRFKVEAPASEPCFGREIRLNINEGTGPVQLDFPLDKGVWITGRVVHDATGAALGGQTIEYHTFNDNAYLRKSLKEKLYPEFDQNMRTNDDGTFRIRGCPGRGIVTAGGGHDYLEAVGVDRIGGLKRDEFFNTIYNPGGFSPYLRNTTIEVNVPENAAEFPCEIRLHKGKSRVVQVVGPDGKPQEHIEASGLDNQIENPIRQVRESSFRVTNLFPGERREVVARFVPRKLMGMAIVSDDGDAPVKLELRPWANLAGRLVEDQGRPLFRGLQVMLEDGKLPIHTLNGREYDKQEFTIEPDGRFKIEGLVPGAKYRLRVIEGNVRLLGDITGIVILRPAENRDLGDLTLPKK